MTEYDKSTSKYRHMSSIEFIEKELGVKLLPYQKVLLALYDTEDWRKSKFGLLRPFYRRWKNDSNTN